LPCPSSWLNITTDTPPGDLVGHAGGGRGKSDSERGQCSKETNPNEPPTVVRMASIPHGTVILAQGTALEVNGGPLIKDNNIIPFPVGGSPPPNSDFAAAEGTFTELNLSVPSSFRSLDPGVTQAIVENPNSAGARSSRALRRPLPH
jgi:hypothetical protein